MGFCLLSWLPSFVLVIGKHVVNIDDMTSSSIVESSSSVPQGSYMGPVFFQTSFVMSKPIDQKLEIPFIRRWF